MNCHISKELFEAVYNCDISTDKDMLESYKRLNIYEFAFKCKVWAFNQGYEIHSNFNEVVAIFKEVRKIENVGHFKRLPLLSWEEIEYDKDTNNEVEAIIKACEWILDNKENQCTK